MREGSSWEASGKLLGFITLGNRTGPFILPPLLAFAIIQGRNGITPDSKEFRPKYGE